MSDDGDSGVNKITIDMTNELGNQIHLSIEDEPYTPGKHKNLRCVTYTMSGPTSTTTNTITVQEARALQRLLTIHLDSKPFT